MLGPVSQPVDTVNTLGHPHTICKVKEVVLPMLVSDLFLPAKCGQLGVGMSSRLMVYKVTNAETAMSQRGGCQVLK